MEQGIVPSELQTLPPLTPPYKGGEQEKWPE